jgi:hypothetical protein
MGIVCVLFGLGNALLRYSPDTSILFLLQDFSIGVIFSGIVLAVVAFMAALHLGSIPVFLNPGELWFGAWVFGTLAFLNTWDSPVYFLVFCVTLWWVSKRWGSSGWPWPFFASLGALILGAGILCLPWLATFSSQAGGVLPNLPFPTKPQHFLVMFGTSFVPVLWWLSRRQTLGKPLLYLLIGVLAANLAWTGAKESTAILPGVFLISIVVLGLAVAIWALIRILAESSGRRALAFTVGIPLGLLLLSWLLGAVVVIFDEALTIDIALSMVGTDDLQFAINETFLRRAEGVWVPLVLGGVLAMSILILDDRELKVHLAQTKKPIQLFIVILIAIGALLVLTPEYLYLRDLFNARMNTIFKFYYSAWVLWGLAAAVAVAQLIPLRLKYPEGLRVLLLLPLGLGLIYPFFALQTKTNRFQAVDGPTLDGIAYLSRINPQDYNAILWINTVLADGVISEAVGGSYSPSHARISAHTGFPTVLGWDFHEVQWRGESTLLGTRRSDIEVLYKTPDWLAAVTILDTYEIDYVYVGPVERRDYQPVNETKFERFMDLIYQSGEVRIYARRK